ncbi:MAG: hypothetical protein A3J63_04580 [Candidatus Moranbacteria bacterium RIFCSPHIGHO2_02_FULL_40_12b]|nr:MAG: hypothetical protein A3J63_04580 [Candidatus Moranbacteria bacterium RIFCSPHIGHO2_02_FULL_40_12b]
MNDNFLNYLLRRVCRFKGVEESVKKNSILTAIILMLAMSVFFFVFSRNHARAEISREKGISGSIFPRELGFKIQQPENYCEDTVKNLKKDGGNAQNNDGNHETKSISPAEKNYGKNNCLKAISENIFTKPPRVGIIKELGKANLLLGDSKDGKSDDKEENYLKKEIDPKETKIINLIAGYPIEKMLPYISKRSDQVSYYLIAIAKKESDWGRHSPKKYGSDCYNYWGYRGTYNPTDSGYSCFDSPEQAINQVGDKIESLLNKMVDTPEELVVWKCGSSCAGHDPGSVKKWISDVKLYYLKISS